MKFNFNLIPFSAGVMMCLVVLLLTVVSSCIINEKIDTQQDAKEIRNIGANFSIYHHTDTSSLVYFKIPILDNKKPKARIELNYFIKTNIDNKNSLYENSFVIGYDKTKPLDNFIIGNFSFPLMVTENKFIIIEVRDLTNNAYGKFTLSADKQISINDQLYKITDTNGYALHSYHFPLGTTLNIETDLGSKSLFCKKYQNNFEMAPPPFAIYQNEQAGITHLMTFPINLDPSEPTKMEFTEPGLYFFQSDTTGKEGLSIFIYDHSYPEVKNAKDYILPLRYITTKKEFQTLSENYNQYELDQFWINTCNSKARAKLMIKEYYSRVEEANQKFTSYLEGWKTDRGMVYIVFGPPNKVEYNDHSEQWIYGEENNYLSLHFNFQKVKNPYSTNDYSLNRSSNYKNSYYKAVDSWRQGRVLVSNN